MNSGPQRFSCAKSQSWIKSAHVEDDEVGNGQADANQPDEDEDELGLELGVLALKRPHDAAVPVQRDDDEGVDAGVDTDVLKMGKCFLWSQSYTWEV
jgi:hypothetical protein